MAVRYYKKTTPETQPTLSNGSKTDFKTLDGLIGWYAIDSEFVQNELEGHMRAGRYNISEVSAEEFVREYVEKKRAPDYRPLKPQWREEIGAGNKPDNRSLIGQVGSEKVVAAVGLANDKPPADTKMEAPAVVPAKEVPFKPHVGQKKKKPDVRENS
jgi:hypothetical protein